MKVYIVFYTHWNEEGIYGYDLEIFPTLDKARENVDWATGAHQRISGPAVKYVEEFGIEKGYTLPVGYMESGKIIYGTRTVEDGYYTDRFIIEKEYDRD